MEKTLPERIWSGIVGFSLRVADGVAQLTNWQFILLGLLALIGANILANILDTRPTKRLAPPVAVAVNKEKPRAADKEAAPAVPERPQAPDDSLGNALKRDVAEPLKDSLKQEILKEIQKEIDSESGELDPANAKRPKKSMDELAADYRKHFGDYGKQMGDYGKRDRGLPLGQIVFFLFIILLAVRITTRSRQRADKRVMSAEASAEVESLRRQVTEAQLQTLQAQVEPHFLFNTLAAVEHLTETDPPRAAIMLRHLIAFLRGSLPNMRELNTSLGREVDLCQSYLAIMQIRMEDRLKVSIDVPEALRGLSFPPMMLQSLVENSIKHGLEPKPEGGAIALSARLQEGRLRVTVADTGLGIADTTSQGIGLSNIRDRLKRLFGNSAALVLAPNAPTGAHITIEVPHDATPASNSGR